jgi:hypothetical protein
MTLAIAQACPSSMEVMAVIARAGQAFRPPVANLDGRRQSSRGPAG